MTIKKITRINDEGVLCDIVIKFNRRIEDEPSERRRKILQIRRNLVLEHLERVREERRLKETA